MMTATLPKLFSLDGQTALVTGGTRGIGQAMAFALAEAGADVLLVQLGLESPYYSRDDDADTTYKRDETNTETKEGILAMGRKSQIYVADLSSQKDVQGLTTRVTTDGYQIDILLNCGGVQRRHPAHKFPSADWDEVLQVNLTTVWTLCRDVGAHMLARPVDSETGRRGVIINVASLLSFQGGWTVPAYAASKGGVAQLTKALSNEWAASGVRVNAIAPGYIATDMNMALINDESRAKSILSRIPAGRWGSPQDFKGSVIYLASQASAYVSGEVLTVDGGWMGR